MAEHALLSNEEDRCLFFPGLEVEVTNHVARYAAFSSGRFRGNGKGNSIQFASGGGLKLGRMGRGGGSRNYGTPRRGMYGTATVVDVRPIEVRAPLCAELRWALADLVWPGVAGLARCS